MSSLAVERNELNEYAEFKLVIEIMQIKYVSPKISRLICTQTTVFLCQLVGKNISYFKSCDCSGNNRHFG